MSAGTVGERPSRFRRHGPECTRRDPPLCWTLTTHGSAASARLHQPFPVPIEGTSRREEGWHRRRDLRGLRGDEQARHGVLPVLRCLPGLGGAGEPCRSERRDRGAAGPAAGPRAGSHDPSHSGDAPAAPVLAQPVRPRPAATRAAARTPPTPNPPDPLRSRPRSPAWSPRRRHRRRHRHRPVAAPPAAGRSTRRDGSADTVASSSSGRAPVLRSLGRRSGARGGPACGTARTGSPDGRTGAVSHPCTAGGE